jgi:adenosylcobinamide-GDP ribazoletransferase
MDSEPQQPPRRYRFIDHLLEAVRFLTIIPVPGVPATGGQALAGAVPFFPLVGLLLGGLLALVGVAAGWLWNDSVRAVAIVIGWGALTAALHLDGLSDTFDGVLSWRPRERKLEIMRDSRIGVMGALALAAVLASKLVFLATAKAWAPMLLVAPALGRWAMCYALCRYPSARADGLGATVQAHSQATALRSATVLATAVALAVAGPRGIIALAIVWLTTRLIARWWVHDLGGLTGDTYGALCELGEVVTLAVLAARV